MAFQTLIIAEEDEGRVAAPQPGGKKRKLINQFNYCERAALTYNNPSRVGIH